MTVANEHVEDIANQLKRAVARQHGGEIIGSIHVFMFQPESGPGRAVILHWVDAEYETWPNMMHIAKDIEAWADKFPTRAEQSDPAPNDEGESTEGSEA